MRLFLRVRTLLTGSALTGLVLAGTALGATAHAAGTTTLPAPRGTGGVYVGGGALSNYDTFSNWRGSRPDFVIDYLARDSWSDIESPSWWTSQWQQRSAQMVLGVPMLLEGSTVTTLQQGAAGSYNSHFVKLAQTLVAGGYANTSLRIGWEMNGDWYKWSAGSDPSAWKAYYRNIVTAMRTVPGQNFTFDWTMNLGKSAMPAEQAYPGDDVVDYIGVDAYDWKWGDSTTTPQDRWQWILTQSYGLNWVTSFAATHGKQITVPEWGLAPTAAMSNGGGGDDPYYVTQMTAWTNQHATYAAYYNAQSHRIDTGSYPNAATTYRSYLTSLTTATATPTVTPTSTSTTTRVKRSSKR